MQEEFCNLIVCWNFHEALNCYNLVKKNFSAFVEIIKRKNNQQKTKQKNLYALCYLIKHQFIPRAMKYFIIFIMFYWNLFINMLNDYSLPQSRYNMWSFLIVWSKSSTDFSSKFILIKSFAISVEEEFHLESTI